MKKKTIVFTLLFILCISFCLSVSLFAGDVKIIDARHYSSVFGEMRNYRIFLPPGYYDNPQKRYPVIYFLHGWDQRYFGSSANDYASYDKGDDNKGDNISNFVSNHDVIVVKSDGYNRSPDELYYVRPYNIGEKNDEYSYRQFPVYYPELVNYIDGTYNTIAKREYRAISGLSMGGFMSFWIGGKYPDLFSAAGSFCGSAEFKVGPKVFPVEYRHLDLYKNYGGMKIRLNYGNKDFIRGYHEDMNKVWTQVMDNYEFKIYEGEHSTSGLGEMFGFFLKTFADPPEKPEKWSHIDVYPEFSVWDYTISTDRDIPGFTILENVDKRGFRCSVREFLPDGELFPFVNITIITPPIYEKNEMYVINDVDPKNIKPVQKTIMSDLSGRLKISINGSTHEIGINRKKDKPNICIASFKTVNMRWAEQGKEVKLEIILLNKGMANGENISASLSSTRDNADIIENNVSFGNIKINNIQVSRIPYSFNIQSDSVEIAQFRLTIHDENKNKWVEFFEIPIKRDLPEIKDFVIADGRTFTVAKAGIDTVSILLGNGNGDGAANPGESIVILVKDQGKYRRTNLYTSDNYINPDGVNIRLSDNWGNYDHVGGSAKYTVPLISSECPQKHNIEFYAEYWLPDYPLHNIIQGKITFEVTGKDSTPPKLCRVRVPGDNIVQAKLYDGSKIQSVKARIILKNNPAKYFEIELKDDGHLGDRAFSDNTFSAIIPQQKFGFYRIIIEAVDSSGNKSTEVALDDYLLH